MSLENPVKTLNAEVARKIAAGEVIDRPNAIVRELMDNATDSGADFITVEISGGGIEKIRVIDNGYGMTKEDLQNCAKPHATSKISTETDLLNLTTLGFRGEALASIAAVARLSIQSGSWKMRASITEDHILEPIAQINGTIVQSEGLFENFPARRMFLKRPATESIMCKNTFIEKVLPRPDIAFRLIIDGQTKIDLPKNQTLKERFVSANSYTEEPDLFFTVSNKSKEIVEGNPQWSFDVIIGEPAVSRTSKKDISIYVNGRKIQEYSLVQAVEYGSQGYFPNGTYPVAGVFINMNPNSVDFNIHPAKKEARFYDISDLHHGLSSAIKNFFLQYTRQNFLQDKNADDVLQTNSNFSFNPNLLQQSQTQNLQNDDFTFRPKNDFSNSKKSSSDAETSFSNLSTTSESTSETYKNHISYTNKENSQILSDFRSKYLGIKSDSSSFPSYKNETQNLAEHALFETENQTEEPKTARYIGHCLGTFLLAEKNNCLYIIDQHAVHERILFDKLMNSQTKTQTQQLLIPYRINTDSKFQDNQLLKLQERLSKIGFVLKNVKEGYWEVTEVPERWTGTEYDLKTLLFVKHVEPEEIIRSIAAMTACKAAIKDGYVIDDETAQNLVNHAFLLKDPHCPHGRPIYTVLSREQLFAMVKRT